MATYTSRLSLRKPSRTAGSDDIIDVASDVNANLDILDQNINMRVATSGARPTAPYTGMMIYETDTGQVRIWNGSAWDYVGSDNTAIGRVGTGTVGYITSTTSSTSMTSASAETLYLSTTFVAAADRRYWVETGINVETTATTSAPGACAARVRWASGGSVANTDTLAGGVGVTITTPQGVSSDGTNAEKRYLLFEIVPAVTGNVTVGLFMATVGTNDTMHYYGASNHTNWLSVRDVGV